MAAMLALAEVDVFYGASQILFDVGFTVAAGETVALLGRNGAGKSTTFKAIAGLAPPARGRITLAGQDLAGAPPHRIARAGIGYVPEDRQIFPDHSVEDNLTIAAKPAVDGTVTWTLERIYDLFPVVADLRQRIAGRLSGGEQQMLTIARTLMGNPSLLLLDEPSEGLAPVIVARIGSLIRDLQGAGVTLLLAEQNLRFCLGIASHAVIIDKGQVVYRDTIAALQADETVRGRYLAV